MTKSALALMIAFIIMIVIMNEYRKHQEPTKIVARTPTTTIIIYNRVPKCGSSSMIAILKFVSAKMKTYPFIHSTNYHQRPVTLKQQDELRRDLLKYSRNAYHRTIVFERHIYFFHWSMQPNTVVQYINLLRDPLQRSLSFYHYSRSRCAINGLNSQCNVINRSLINVTMEDCVSTGDPLRCITSFSGVSSAIPFFCGQLPICNDYRGLAKNDAALALAKSNIERYYSYVGLLEYIESSLELLEYIHPLIFSGISESSRMNMTKNPVNRTPAKYVHPISNETAVILRRVLKYDYELYDFVKQRFFGYFTRVFHRPPRPSHSQKTN